MKFVLLCVVAMAISGSTFGDPRVCYGCSNNSTCNDPVNLTSTYITDCLNPTFNAETVCIKVSFHTDEEGSLTSRGCYNKTMSGQDACTYLKNSTDYIAPNATDFSCHTCTSNLCNSSATIISSILLIVGLFASVYRIN